MILNLYDKKYNLDSFEEKVSVLKKGKSIVFTINIYIEFDDTYKPDPISYSEFVSHSTFLKSLKEVPDCLQVCKYGDRYFWLFEGCKFIKSSYQWDRFNQFQKWEFKLHVDYSNVIGSNKLQKLYRTHSLNQLLL